MATLVEDTIGKVQRISTELRPGLLDDLGLSSAIEWYSNDFEARTGIKCNISINPGEVVVDEGRSTALFRIFQEIMTNVARHAEADRVKVNVQKNDGQVSLEVTDNGVGITESQVSSPTSLGIIGMQERLYTWDGEIEFLKPDSGGTVISVIIPLDDKEKQDD